MQKKLQFRKNGSFRILCFSDFQETFDAFDPRTLQGVNAALDAENPDLVMLCGDNCNGPEIHCEEELVRYLGKMLQPFVDRGIPWCHVNGNHDYDAQVPMDRQLEIYKSISGCRTESVSGIPGTTNFMLPVYSSDGEKVVSAVWGLDAGHSIDEIRKGLTGEALIDGLPLPASIWNIIRFEQQMWYWNQSADLERRSGAKVPGVMAFHVAPWEFDYMRRYEKALGVVGNTTEEYGLGALNSGIFSTLVQRGDMKCILCGHTHINTCSARYCGIEMCNVGSAGYSAYGEDDLRGGRIVELNENHPDEISTRMVYFRNYV